MADVVSWMETLEPRVLVVTRDQHGSVGIRTGLVADGCKVRSSYTAESALTAITEWHPSIVILDEIFADFMHAFRSVSERTLSITIRSNSRNRFADLLQNGADDCVDNTCTVVELRARIRTKLKHAYRSAGLSAERKGYL